MSKYEKLKNKLINNQSKIFYITLKYDPSTTHENYQELSVIWLKYMTTLDKILIKRYAKRTLKLVSKIKKEND